MTKRNMWVAVLAAPMMIAMLLFAGSSSVKANEQPSTANAEVKIDNFSFGPQTLTVPVGATVTYPPHRGQHRRCLQVQGAGYGRKVLLHV
jgi:plastocyanin